MVTAAKMVKEQNCSVYKVSKENSVPWSSLKDYLSRGDESCISKLGRPFALTPDLEIEIFRYIINMQKLGFGLTVFQVRKIALQLAKVAGYANLFNEDSETASKWWWTNFKKRYNLFLRIPENLAIYRASMANDYMINDFYLKL